GMHTVYVRAQDNDETYSEVSAKLGFTAETITPEAEITRPNIGSGILQVGSQIQISWDGLDPDSPEPRKKPSDYLFKLVRLDTLNPPIPILTASPDFVMWKASAHIPWTFQSAETTNTSYFLDTPGNYMFSVRAVDVAGAEEPFVEFVRADGDPGNTFKMSALQAGGQPELRVTEPSLGTIAATGAGVVEYEVATGQRLFFEWIANAESYGGVVEGYNWGINIPDLDRDGPNSGWRGWSTLTGNLDPIVFNTPGTNVVNVRVRDTGGVTTTITIILTVIEFELSRELLVVDDWKDGIWPRDDAHDAFWMETLTNSGRLTEEELIPEVIMFHSHGDNDIEFRDPDLPKLEFLGKYRTIIYDTSANGYNGRSGLVNTGPIRRHLGSYLRAGGKLWVTGESTVAAMLPTVTGQADFAYPKEGIMAGDFPYDFMRLYTSRVENDKNVDNDKNGIIGVRSLPNQPEFLPPMDIDREKRSPIIRGEGVGSWDAIFDPIFQQDDSQFHIHNTEDDIANGYRSQIDSLYVSVTNDRRSTFNNKLVGTRWSDTHPDRRHGRVMWFGFPVYYMLNEDFQEVFNTAFDWFKEESAFEKPRQNQ
ncbi:MAG: hypothetical protein HKN21_07770, partial [Candidatus Eisenbacteria bacterium]|nr:hypothetical protein [Candidatus Eisenbacteria bacterium]